jgi:hypothetical protein
MTNMIIGFLLGVLLYMGTISAVVTHRRMFGEYCLTNPSKQPSLRLFLQYQRKSDSTNGLIAQHKTWAQFGHRRQVVLST